MATDPPPTVFFYPWFTIYFVKKSLRRPLSGTSLPLASFLFLLSRLFLLVSSSFVSISHFMASILQDLNVYQIIWKQLSLSKFMFYVFENVEVGSQLCFVKVDKSESQILSSEGWRLCVRTYLFPKFSICLFTVKPSSSGRWADSWQLPPDWLLVVTWPRARLWLAAGTVTPRNVSIRISAGSFVHTSGHRPGDLAT